MEVEIDLDEVEKIYPWSVKIEDRAKTDRILRENFKSSIVYYIENDRLYFLRPEDFHLFNTFLMIY